MREEAAAIGSLSVLSFTCNEATVRVLHFTSQTASVLNNTWSHKVPKVKPKLNRRKGAAFLTASRGRLYWLYRLCGRLRGK